MNRHKKTRQQKIISQLRRHLREREPMLSLSPAIATVSSPPGLLPSTPSNSSTPPIIVSTVSRDLFKTIFITATIISLELILYFLLERR